MKRTHTILLGALFAWAAAVSGSSAGDLQLPDALIPAANEEHPEIKVVPWRAAHKTPRRGSVAKADTTTSRATHKQAQAEALAQPVSHDATRPSAEPTKKLPSPDLSGVTEERRRTQTTGEEIRLAAGKKRTTRKQSQQKVHEAPQTIETNEAEEPTPHKAESTKKAEKTSLASPSYASALNTGNRSTANPYGEISDRQGLRPYRPGVKYDDRSGQRHGGGVFGSLFGR